MIESKVEKITIETEVVVRSLVCDKCGKKERLEKEEQVYYSAPLAGWGSLSENGKSPVHFCPECLKSLWCE